MCVFSSSSQVCLLSTTRRLCWSSRIFSTEVRLVFFYRSRQTCSTWLTCATLHIYIHCLTVLVETNELLMMCFCCFFCHLRYSLAWGRGGAVCKLKKCDWNPPDHGHDKKSRLKGWGTRFLTFKTSLVVNPAWNSWIWPDKGLRGEFTTINPSFQILFDAVKKLYTSNINILIFDKLLNSVWELCSN